MAQLKRYNGTSWENVGGSVAPKTSQTTSDTDTYSCNYVNNNLTNIKSAIDYKSPDYMGDVVVGSIRTKNIFGNYAIINGWIYGTTLRVNSENGNRMAFVSCKPNTEYTISRSVITSTFRVSCYTTIPSMTSSNVDYTIPTTVENNNGTIIHFTTNSTAKYLIVHYGAQEDAQLNQSLATIQVEEGTEETEYSPYQNLNGYDNYSTVETRIGTWINGKPLYRKTIYTTSKTGSLNISNVDFLRFTNGNVRASSNIFPLARYTGSNDAIDFYISGGNYNLALSSAWDSNFQYLVFDIEYTKTTD